MNKKNQKSISGNSPKGGFIFISQHNEILSGDTFADYLFDSFTNLPLKRQKQILDEMEREEKALQKGL